MLLLRICKRCEAFLNVNVQVIRMASTRALVVSEENDLVLKKLGFVERDYRKVLSKRTVRELNLQRVVDMLTRLGFTAEEMKKQPNVLRLHPYLIDHRYKLLEESGVEKEKITLKRISKFPKLNTTVIEELKKNSLISETTDVVRNILSFSNVPVERYPPDTSDSECLGNAQTTALQTFLSWKLGLSMEEVKQKYQSYDNLHQKSIRLVMQSYDVLVNILGHEKIIKNIYLLETHPENLLEILNLMPKLGKTSVRRLVINNPKLLARPLYKVLQVIEILKKYKIPEESIVAYSGVLTLSPETVQERVTALHHDPLFNMFFSNPRICFIIARYHTSLFRYRLLKDMKWRCLSSTLLTAVQEDFQKRIDLGHDENRGNDIVHYLRRHLGYELKEIKQRLRRHPFFYLMPLTAVGETVQLLLASGVDKADILDALTVVLYPKEKVARWLQQVHSQPEVMDLLDKDGRLPSHLLLQLVLYYMERPYDFSGHGVWSEQDLSNLSYRH